MIVAVFRNQENVYLFEYAYSTGNEVRDPILASCTYNLAFFLLCRKMVFWYIYIQSLSKGSHTIPLPRKEPKIDCNINIKLCEDKWLFENKYKHVLLFKFIEFKIKHLQ